MQHIFQKKWQTDLGFILYRTLTTSNIPGLSNLIFKVLKAIAQEHGVNVTSKTTKAELVEALQNIDVILDNLKSYRT